MNKLISRFSALLLGIGIALTAWAGLETATYIDDLDSSNPTSSDAASQGDDHLRLIKSTILATFPNITGEVTATHTELNLLDGVTATTAELNILDGVTATAAELNKLDGVTATSTELNYTDGVTSAIQTQINTGGINITGRTGTTKTLSTSAPSGGSNGDIWYRYN